MSSTIRLPTRLPSARLAPFSLHDLRYRKSLIDIAVQHRLDELDARLAHDPGYAEFVVENFVDAVEGVFFVDEGVEQDAQGPDVLLLATVGFAL